MITNLCPSTSSRRRSRRRCRAWRPGRSSSTRGRDDRGPARAQGAQHRHRQGGARRQPVRRLRAVGPGQLVSPSLGFNEELQPYPYDPEKAKALIKEAGAEGKTINLVGESGPLAQGPRADRGGRRLLDRGRPRRQLQILEFGAYLTCSSTGRTGPTRSSCQLQRAPRRRPPARRRLRGGRHRASNSDMELATHRLRPHRDRSRSAGRDLRRDQQEGLRPGILRLAPQQRGHLRHGRARRMAAAGRRQADRQGNVGDGLSTSHGPRSEREQHGRYIVRRLGAGSARGARRDPGRSSSRG